LSNSNTYTGATTINGGLLSVNLLANGDAASGIGQSSNAATNLVFGGNGTLQYTGGTVSIDRAFSINAGATGTIEVATAGTTLTLPGTTGAATTGALTKAGNGTLTLTGANTHTGNTTLTGGTLNLTGSASLTGLPASTRLNIHPAVGNGVVNYTSTGSSTLFSVTGATVAGAAFFVEIAPLGGRERLAPHRVEAVIVY
jgi:fibronectin-binding autotransporter adhesin